MESPPKMSHDSFTFRFPARLWRIINSCSSGAISWGPSGKTIRILRKKFEEEYLTGDAKAFKTGKYESFVRQLNHYGFKKVKKRSAVKKITPPIMHGETKDEAAMLSEYHHPNFARGQPERVTFLERRSQLQAAEAEAGGAKKRSRRPQRPARESSEQTNHDRSDMSLDHKMKKDPSVEVSHSLFSPAADGNLGNGHAAGTQSFGYREKTESAQKQVASTQAELSMLTWDIEQTYPPASALKLVSPVYRPLRTTPAGARSTSTDGIHSQRRMRPVQHRPCYETSNTVPFEPRFLGPPPPFPQHLPSLPWQPPFRPGHQQPVMCDDYVLSHSREDVYASRRLESRPFFGAGLRQGPRVYPAGSYPDHRYNPHVPPPPPPPPPPPHLWESGYRLHGRGAAFPMSEVYEDEFNTQQFLGGDLARFPLDSVYQYERSSSRGCRYFPGPAETFSPLSPCHVNMSGPGASSRAAPFVACNGHSQVYGTAEEGLQTPEERCHAARQILPAFDEVATSGARSFSEANKSSEVTGFWKVGVKETMDAHAAVQTTTPDVNANVASHVPSNGMGSNSASAHEPYCRWTNSCTENHEDVPQDYITADGADLPLDVAEETVVTCNTVSGVTVSDCAPYSVEETAVMDTLTDNHAPRPLQGAAKALSENHCFGPFSQCQSHDLVSPSSSSSSSHGEHPDSFGVNQGGPLSSNGLSSTWKHPSLGGDRELGRHADFREDVSHAWTFPASHQLNETGTRGAVTADPASRTDDQDADRDTVNENHPPTTDHDSQCCDISPPSSSGGGGRREEPLRARVVVQREERGDLTHLSSTSVQQLLSAALHTPGMEIVVDENYHPEKMALVIPKEKRRELNGCV